MVFYEIISLQSFIFVSTLALVHSSNSQSGIYGGRFKLMV